LIFRTNSSEHKYCLILCKSDVKRVETLMQNQTRKKDNIILIFNNINGRIIKRSFRASYLARNLVMQLQKKKMG